MDPFVKDASEYTRKLNPIGDYVSDAALHLSTMTGDPIEKCRQFVVSNLKPGGLFEFKDPKVVYLQRQENGDRERHEGTLRGYINEVIADKDILAPTFTSYVNTDVKESVLATYIDNNISMRNKAKKEMFAAKAAGHKMVQAIKKSEQTNRKLANNAISGAHVTPSTPLYNKTAHSTLTSVCRSTSGYGNANNEKLLSGNRHYYHWRVVQNNIISIINHTDYAALDALMHKYNLNYPSVAQSMQCITYSTDLYWRNNAHVQKLEAIISRLSPSQRAAFVYTGDFYHLMLFNQDFIRDFITELSNKVYGVCEDPHGVLKKAQDGYLNLAHQICAEETMGLGKDYTSILETQKIHTLAMTVLNIEQTVLKYADLIKVIMVSDNLPASMAYFPNSIRRAAVTSDTDSTIFTVQDWIVWYMGKVDFSPRGIAVQAAMTFIASSAIVHILATMSANIGIAKKHIFRVAMKSEFRFDVFVPTQLGKHYYASIGCQEGNVFEEQETEIKGVHLKNSNISKKITEASQVMMEDIMATVMRGEKISIMKYLKQVADVERSIINSINHGETDYLRIGSIKDAASYTKTAEDSPYQIHLFWNEVFGPKYGTMPPPPYATAKLSLTTENTSSTKAWLEDMQDQELKNRLMKWLTMKNRTMITTFNVPIQILQTSGIPHELTPVINYRKIVSELCKSFYLILETLGFYTMEEKVTRLVSDFY